MDPIVSPWLIYLLGVVNPIMSLFLMVGIISIFIYGFSFLYKSLELEELMSKGKKRLLLIVSIVFIFVAVLIPSRDTMIGMYVANNVTYDTIQQISKTGKEWKDVLKKDLIDIITKVNDKESKK